MEEHFRQAMTTGVWHQRLEFPSGEIIVMHSPHAMVHFMPNRFVAGYKVTIQSERGTVARVE